jgi:hypothetical protein
LFTRSWVVATLLLLLAGAILPYSTQAQNRVISTVSGSSSLDPDKAPSEFNHHLAGYALIAVGLFVLTGVAVPKLRSMQMVWPLVFVMAGIFLAVWSDAEIWPRGNLSWVWLLHHDAEARQHKVYAVLLVALGLLEYLRNRGLLGGLWRIGSFPILAALGASLLLFHDHGGSSGVRSPEAKNYLINPQLDFDGKPWPVDSTSDPHSVVSELQIQSFPTTKPMTAMPLPAIPPDSAMSFHSMHPDGEAVEGTSTAVEQRHAGANNSPMSMDGDAMSMPESAVMDHHHHMTPSMLIVQREHLWFMIVGLGIAVFKFLSDLDFRNRRFILYFWPSATIVLGVLLTLYRE